MGAPSGGDMPRNEWTEAFGELADTVVAALVRFWKHDMVQVGLTIGLFLGLATPIILVMLALWFVDATGWRPATGFYKIG
jgi:hypothetical protein